MRIYRKIMHDILLRPSWGHSSTWYPSHYFCELTNGSVCVMCVVSCMWKGSRTQVVKLSTCLIIGTLLLRSIDMMESFPWWWTCFFCIIIICKFLTRKLESLFLLRHMTAYTNAMQQRKVCLWDVKVYEKRRRFGLLLWF